MNNQKPLIVAFLVISAAVASFAAGIDQRVMNKPEKGYTGKPGVHILRVDGTVLQVIDKGVLLSPWMNRTLEPYKDDRGILHDGGTQMTQTLAVMGAPTSLVDGDRFQGIIYPAGRMTYVGTDGAQKTVQRYATTPQLASSLISQQK